VLKRELGVTISAPEAIDFWKWRSDEWDSSFLSVHDDSEILEWFRKFIHFIGVEQDDDEENIPETLPPPGVKVVVKDSEGVPWEIEMDPEYHAQIVDQIESQLSGTQKGEGTITFVLEYDPDKIWNMRKLEGK